MIVDDIDRIVVIIDNVGSSQNQQSLFVIFVEVGNIDLVLAIVFGVAVVVRIVIVVNNGTGIRAGFGASFFFTQRSQFDQRPTSTRTPRAQGHHGGESRGTWRRTTVMIN